MVYITDKTSITLLPETSITLLRYILLIKQALLSYLTVYITDKTSITLLHDRVYITDKTSITLLPDGIYY